VPSTWLAGRRDRLVDPRAMRDAAALRPMRLFQVVEHAGHAPFLTHADEVAMRVDGFLQGLVVTCDRTRTASTQRHVRRAFSRSAGGYDAAAALQHAVEASLLESLDYLDDPKLARPPPAMRARPRRRPRPRQRRDAQRWPKARVVAVDLRDADAARSGQAQRLVPAVRPRVRRRARLAVRRRQRRCPVLESLPAMGRDLRATFAGFRRVLKPRPAAGLHLRPDTLIELREAFAHADAAPHVSPFATHRAIRRRARARRLPQSVLDRELHETHYPDLPALMRELESHRRDQRAARRRTR
jgi:malonyl-CoA O-methyltransferase